MQGGGSIITRYAAVYILITCDMIKGNCLFSLFADTTPVSIRLVGGSVPNEGNVEVLFNGEWAPMRYTAVYIFITFVYFHCLQIQLQ